MYLTHWDATHMAQSCGCHHETLETGRAAVVDCDFPVLTRQKIWPGLECRRTARRWWRVVFVIVIAPCKPPWFQCLKRYDDNKTCNNRLLAWLCVCLRKSSARTGDWLSSVTRISSKHCRISGGRQLPWKWLPSWVWLNIMHTNYDVVHC